MLGFSYLKIIERRWRISVVVLCGSFLLLKSNTWLERGAPVSWLLGLVGADLQAWAFC